MGGTIRWMSPELFYPDRFGLKGTRPTKQSDCYALGMVIYEVLSGQAPFTPFHYCVVILKVIEGERPTRPNGPERVRFSNNLWKTLNQCWATKPQCRPSAATVLECLEQVSGDSEVPFQQVDDGAEMDRDDSDVASDSSEGPSRFNTRCFVVFLCSILYLLRLHVITRKIFASRCGETDLGRSLPTYDHS